MTPNPKFAGVVEEELINTGGRSMCLLNMENLYPPQNVIKKSQLLPTHGFVESKKTPGVPRNHLIPTSERNSRRREKLVKKTTQSSQPRAEGHAWATDPREEC